jgi:hypothetical protein
MMVDWFTFLCTADDSVNALSKTPEVVAQCAIRQFVTPHEVIDADGIMIALDQLLAIDHHAISGIQTLKTLQSISSETDWRAADIKASLGDDLSFIKRVATTRKLAIYDAQPGEGYCHSKTCTEFRIRHPELGHAAQRGDIFYCRKCGSVNVPSVLTLVDGSHVHV